MEQARYWMWAKKKPNSIGDSWEEQAFAEDAAGTLGGSVWPPRSYSCSFCRREFRSAQALGGHMNVHRRDRARLKESPPDVVVQDHAPPLNTLSTSTTFLYNNDRYSSPNPEIRVSSAPAAVMVTDATLSFLPPASDVVSWEQLFPASRACFVAEKRDLEFGCLIKDGNSCRRKRVVSSDDDDEVISCKRVRIEEKASMSLFPKLRAVVVRSVAQSEEVLDLELRLGNASKVK